MPVYKSLSLLKIYTLKEKHIFKITVVHFQELARDYKGADFN